MIHIKDVKSDQSMRVSDHVFIMYHQYKIGGFFPPRFLRGIAYRQFTRLVHGRLKEKIIPLPACAYHAIRSTFKVEGDNFGGYEELVSEQE